MAICLVIDLFHRDRDELVTMLQLEESDLQFFRETLCVPDEDPLMYGAYKIDVEANEKIYQRYGFRLDLKRFECFASYRGSL
ncbi:DUF7683 domain-containing protein [Brucella haematophila]|uniref:DUF7683 domain-containing protein n=1 Tax=Brucella haematophila TaxID=419474 RepID=UPI00110D2BB6|nr:hypothetical protein [Brucella haematophila]TMV04509.1 hypothetical protein FGI60_06405 [Brucella haematophila]